MIHEAATWSDLNQTWTFLPRKAHPEKYNDVDVEKQTVSFEGDRNVMCKKLSAMGYPEQSSDEAKNVLKKARSFLSCAIGKTKQKQ